LRGGRKRRFVKATPRVAARGFKKIIPLDLAPLTSDFCNKICHEPTLTIFDLNSQRLALLRD
jgi:hypothetical protein